MAKSHGERRKTRHKLTKTVREKGLSSVSRATRQYEVGEIVNIEINPGEHKGIPNPKFQGKTGKITAAKGRAYVVEVSDGNAVKEITVRPQHLKSQK